MKAYPFLHKHPTSGETTVSEGMDLRDWFAGIVLPRVIKEYEEFNSYTMFDIAEIAYQYADAMLKARKEVPNE